MTCRRRPNLTELTIRRTLELIQDFDFEFVVVYDGNDPNYVDHIKSLYDFDLIITNPGRRRFRFDLLNDAAAFCSGDYFMHTENDFYWENQDALRNGIMALEAFPELRLVRLEGIIPWFRRQFEWIKPIGVDEVGLLKLPPDGPVHQFVLGPHVRIDKFPVKNGFLKRATPFKQPEAVMAQQWTKEGKRSGCLLGGNFRHLGIYDSGGRYKPYYADRLTHRRRERTIDNPLEEFKAFCDNAEYIELFKQYLKENKQ